MPKKLAKGHTPAVSSISTIETITNTSTFSSPTSAGTTAPTTAASSLAGASTAVGSSTSSAAAEDTRLPKLIIFDLDYTLWPFWVDTHVTPPLKTLAGSSNTAAVDRIGEHFTFYADVPSILSALPRAGVRVGVASRTHAPDLAREMLKLLYVVPNQEPPALRGAGAGVLRRGSGLGKGDGEEGGNTSNKPGKKEKAKKALELFDAGLEIYPSSKLKHMEALAKKTGIPYSEMLFFDDESRNREVEDLGVTMCLVPDGLSWAELDRGLREWRARRLRN